VIFRCPLTTFQSGAAWLFLSKAHTGDRGRRRASCWREATDGRQLPLGSPCGGDVPIQVVPRDAATGPHVTISASGVVYVTPGASSAAQPTTEFTPLAVWLRELAAFNALRQLRVFVLYRRRKAFRTWHCTVRHLRRERACNRLRESLFMAHPSIAPLIMDVRRNLHDAYQCPLTFFPLTKTVRAGT
jgi:hypothetical protein